MKAQSNVHSITEIREDGRSKEGPDAVEIVDRLIAVLSASLDPDWFTETELAIYLRLVDKKGNPVTAGIKSWVARNEEDGPLPRRFLGDKPRFYRPDVLRWTEEETERQKQKLLSRTPKSVTPSRSRSKIRPTLTAAAS